MKKLSKKLRHYWIVVDQVYFPWSVETTKDRAICYMRTSSISNSAWKVVKVVESLPKRKRATKKGEK